jgi:hypothetical protein
MKYAITVIVTAVACGILGLVAAWGVTRVPPGTGADPAMVAFISFVTLPLGGLVSGVVIGLLAVYVGSRLSRRESSGDSHRSS